MAARICLALWLPISFGLGGCSTYRAASYPVFADTADQDGGDPALPVVGFGDRVEVTLRDGARLKGRVMAAAPEVLTLTHGDHLDADKEPRVRIAVDTIQAIKVREHSPGRTVGLVTIIVGTLVGTVAALFALGGGMDVGMMD